MQTSSFVQKLLISFCVNQNRNNNNNFKWSFLFEKALIITNIPWCSEF